MLIIQRNNKKLQKLGKYLSWTEGRETHSYGGGHDKELRKTEDLNTHEVKERAETAGGEIKHRWTESN